MKITEILRFLDAEQIPYVFRGSAESEVARFSSLTHYKPGTFTWVKTQENLPEGFDCAAVALAFVSEGVTGAFPNVIETPQSKHAFFSVMEHIFTARKKAVPPLDSLPTFPRGSSWAKMSALGTTARLTVTSPSAMTP